MKVVLATLGSLGDLYPFMALGLALRALGHEPILATHEEFRPLVAPSGLAFSAMRPSHDDIVRTTGIALSGLVQRASQDPWFLLRDVYLPFTPKIYEDISALADDAALIVTHNWVFGAIIAAEARQIPLVRVNVSPLFLQSAMRPSTTGGAPYVPEPKTAVGQLWNRAVREIVRRQLHKKMAPAYAFRRKIGLPNTDYDFVFDFGRDDPAALILGLYSPVLAKLQPDHPAKAQLMGFPQFDGGPRAMPPGLAPFLADGPAPVVFTLGSFVVNASEDFYRNGLAACRALGLRSVLIAGEDEIARLKPLLGPDTFACGYAPHSEVFPRCAAIVHHGGIGTTGQALKSGKPQLVVPFLGDQPDNSRRLVALGVARRLMAVRRFRPEACTAVRLKDELGCLLARPNYARTAATVARRIAGEHGASAAANRLDALLSAQKPQWNGGKTMGLGRSKPRPSVGHFPVSIAVS